VFTLCGITIHQHTILCRHQKGFENASYVFHTQLTAMEYFAQAIQEHEDLLIELYKQRSNYF